MAMNREQRRYLQKQGQIDADGNPVAAPRGEARPPERGERSSPPQYIREVRSEMRRVNWPTRHEVVNYTIVVTITVVVLTAFIAGLDYLFAEGVLRILRLAS
jgi:preprotein translocase subunit SecE